MEEKLPIGLFLTDAVKRLLRMQSDLASITTNLLSVGEAINTDFEDAVQAEVEKRLSSTTTEETPTNTSEDIVC